MPEDGSAAGGPWAILWGLATVGIALAFADALWLTLPRKGRRTVASRTKARMLLGGIELACAGGAFLVGSVPIVTRLPSWMHAAGAVLAILGAFLAVWAKVRLGRFFTINLAVVEDHDLVTGGPYAAVRHPIYLGIVVYVMGTGLAWNRLAFGLLAAAWTACFLVQLAIEERVLVEHFGSRYEVYRRRVPAFLPFPRPRGEATRP